MICKICNREVFSWWPKWDHEPTLVHIHNYHTCCDVVAYKIRVGSIDKNGNSIFAGEKKPRTIEV